MSATMRAVGWRLLYGIPVILLVTLGAAALADVMPGSPAQAILGDTAASEAVAALNERYGFDRPLPERYLDWASSALRGDLGLTLIGREPVVDLLLRRLAVTAQLTVMALGLSLVVAIPLALYASLHQGGLADRTLHGFSSALLSVPSFVSVILLALVFTAWLGLFPATGWAGPTQGLGQNLRYAALPTLALATYETAFFYRVMRADLISTLREDFVLVARSKGLSKSYILLRHVFRPSLNSLITVVSMALGRLLGGAIIVEYFFSVPGLGAEALNAVAAKDLGVLQAIVGLAVVMYVAIFIIVDLAYAWIDPRVSVR